MHFKKGSKKEKWVMLLSFILEIYHYFYILLSLIWRWKCYNLLSLLCRQLIKDTLFSSSLKYEAFLEERGGKKRLPFKMGKWVWSPLTIWAFLSGNCGVFSGSLLWALHCFQLWSCQGSSEPPVCMCVSVCLCALCCRYGSAGSAG